MGDRDALARESTSERLTGRATMVYDKSGPATRERPGPDTEGMTSMQAKPNQLPQRGTHDWYAALAERATETALGKIRSNEDAGGDLSLAAAAWDVVMGIADDDTRADMDEYVLTEDGDGYGLDPHEEECICSPEMRATGGFTSRCPVHGRG